MALSTLEVSTSVRIKNIQPGAVSIKKKSLGFSNLVLPPGKRNIERNLKMASRIIKINEHTLKNLTKRGVTLFEENY